MFQSATDKQFQQNVIDFKKTLQSKTTWEELEAYVGYKLEKGDRFKAFILAYLNRDFEPLDFDDGREYYCTQKGCTWLGQDGSLKACCDDDKDAIKKYRGGHKVSKKEYHAAYYEKNRGAILQSQKAYNEKHKGAIKEYHAAYRAKNKEHKKEYDVAYRKENQEAIAKYQAAYREDHKNAKKEYNAAYYKKNKDQQRAQWGRTYYKRNRQRILEYQKTYREYNRQHKLYYCNVCEGQAFGLRANLVEHYESQMHVRNIWTNEMQRLSGVVEDG